ncbi:MAG: BolA family protein [bacterium]
MSRASVITEKLQQQFSPLHLEVDDESHMHSVPEGAESHFRVVVVSEQFEGKMLIARHRAVNESLQEEFTGGLHALSIHAMTPEEWFAKGGQAPESPPCLGGSKTEMGE